MRILLDTHAFVWWLEGSPRLSRAAQSAIGDPGTEVFVSAATAWEIATKCRMGKLPGVQVAADDLVAVLHAHGFEALDVTVTDGQRAGNLPQHHKDPFDRMLIAQALRLDIPLVTNETLFDAYGIRRVW